MSIRNIIVAVAAALLALGAVFAHPAAATHEHYQVVGAGSTATITLEVGPALVSGVGQQQVFFCDVSWTGLCPAYNSVWANFIWTGPVSALVDCSIFDGRTWYGHYADQGESWILKVIDGTGGRRDRIGVAPGEITGDGRCGAAQLSTRPVVAGGFTFRPLLPGGPA